VKRSGVTYPTNVKTASSACASSSRNTNNSTCAGYTDAVSGALDWRPWKRVDVYAGVMYSKVGGGMANGYAHADNAAFTGGVRVIF